MFDLIVLNSIEKNTVSDSAEIAIIGFLKDLDPVNNAKDLYQIEMSTVSTNPERHDSKQHTTRAFWEVCLNLVQIPPYLVCPLKKTNLRKATAMADYHKLDHLKYWSEKPQEIYEIEFSLKPNLRGSVSDFFS